MPKELIVSWPATGKRDIYKNVTVNQGYILREGDSKLRPLAFGPPF